MKDRFIKLIDALPDPILIEPIVWLVFVIFVISLFAFA
jgi:hypothetical protein